MKLSDYIPRDYVSCAACGEQIKDTACYSSDHHSYICGPCYDRLNPGTPRCILCEREFAQDLSQWDGANPPSRCCDSCSRLADTKGKKAVEEMQAILEDLS